MDWYGSLKKVWKKLGINGHVKNFSSFELWVVNTDNGPVARKLPPGFKSPPKVDIEGFKRVDGLANEGPQTADFDQRWVIFGATKRVEEVRKSFFID